jgi:hypothetical protein
MIYRFLTSSVHALATPLLVLGLCHASNRASADHIIGVASGYTPGTAPIVHIDPQTGAFTTISTGGRSYNALAQNSSGDLFGGWFNSSKENGRISRFNSTNGTLLETFAANTPGAGDIRGLGFDANDHLYAVVNRDDNQGAPTLPDDLYRIDLVAETTLKIGSLDFGSVQGFDIAPNGDFFAWDINSGLLQIDAETGVATDVNPAIGGTGDIQSIAFSPNGQLFGARQNLYSINTTTGAFTQIGSGNGIDLRGIEYIIPEPTTLLLSVLSITSLLPWRKT